MQQGYYRTEHLTLKMLAERLELPEYRTRALINKQLGYRNFNDYINQLRIAEASKRLISDPETPVLNIALDVGYRTLSSFNRAFREIKQSTPTEFRRNNTVL
ncbi:helix-turn-helix domain-containing protein [Marinobacter sp.]